MKEGWCCDSCVTSDAGLMIIGDTVVVTTTVSPQVTEEERAGTVTGVIRVCVETKIGSTNGSCCCCCSCCG